MKSILGVYSDAGTATEAVRALTDAHVDASEIVVTEVSAEGRRELPVETRTGERRFTAYGTAIGMAVYVILIGLLQAGVLVDPGIGFVAESPTTTLGRVLFVGGGAGALTGYILGLAVWQISFDASKDMIELIVALRVSERRVAEMKSLLEASGAERVDVT